VDWYIKAEDIVLKKSAAPAGNPQNTNQPPQGKQKTQ